MTRGGNMSEKIIDIKSFEYIDELGDPFILRRYHLDKFPRGNGAQGTRDEDIKGKTLGNDFDHESSFKMYFGRDVPGYPIHPHRGFETITIVLDGLVDHFDSRGARGRYGKGDVQWLTAGEGMQHSEVFPLVHDNKDNRTELFQIWLNLPIKDKMCKSYYQMMWREEIPEIEEDNNGKKTRIKIVAGSYKGVDSLEANPNSWARDRKNHVNIWLIDMEEEGSFNIPKISKSLKRKLYLYKGGDIEIDGKIISAPKTISLNGNSDIEVRNKDKKSLLLLLEGEPIGEPVLADGPFIMTNKEEIKQAHRDYNRTQFGGWPWDSREPVNLKRDKRFVDYGQGDIEYPDRIDK